MIKLIKNTGFHMSFSNNWTISVQFGFGTYSDNYRHPDGIDFYKKSPHVFSETCEIAIFQPDGEMYNFGYDTVKGYITMDELAEWIHKVSKF